MLVNKMTLKDSFDQWQESTLKKSLDRFQERKPRFETSAGIELPRVALPANLDSRSG